MKSYEVTITETLQMTVEVEAATREQAQELVERKWNDSEYILDAEAFKGVDFPQGKRNAAGIMNANIFSVGGKMFGRRDERYAIYQQASPL